VRVIVDPTVLGGFVATIGDTVVDGSARHRLDLLKERLEMPEAAITTGDPS
jgi:F-type H+-transporting ATPase subunit delta